MNDTLKSKTRKATKEVSPSLTLDAALKTIEASDVLIKKEIAVLASHPAGEQVSADVIMNAVAGKIAIPTLGSYVAGSFIAASLGMDMVATFVMPGIGILTLIGVGVFPDQFGRILIPRKRKELKSNAEIDNMFNTLAKEEFQRKEQEILQNVKEAWDFANNELEDQGYSILYSSSTGFSIESTKPLNVSQWDTLRLEAVRSKGAKAVGIRPKAKELAV